MSCPYKTINKREFLFEREHYCNLASKASFSTDITGKCWHIITSLTNEYKTITKSKYSLTVYNLYVFMIMIKYNCYVMEFYYDEVEV